MSAPWDQRSAAAHRRAQALALHPWVEMVAASSSFWSERFAAAGEDPARVRTPDDLLRLPPVRESELAGAGGPGAPALLVRPDEQQASAVASAQTLLRTARAIRRGGERGRRMALLEEYKPIHLHEVGRERALGIAYTRSDLDRLHRAGARASAVLGLTDADYLVSAMPGGPTLEFWGVYHLAMGSSILAVHTRAGGRPLEAAVEGFALVPASAVVVAEAEATDLAALVVDAGGHADGVRVVVAVGPPPSAERRQAVAEAWRAAGAARDVRVAAVWAPAAARALWAECPSSAGGGTGLHTYPDMEVVEVVDPATGRSTRGGGDLTYTSAGWHGTALVRFQTGDYVAGIDAGPCPACGRSVPRVMPDVVPVAWELVARTAAGTLRLDLRGAASVLASHPTVSSWRVELRSGDERHPEDGYVVELAGDLDHEALVDLDRRLTDAVRMAPIQLVVTDDQAVAERVSDAGQFADAR